MTSRSTKLHNSILFYILLPQVIDLEHNLKNELSERITEAVQTCSDDIDHLGKNSLLIEDRARYLEMKLRSIVTEYQ